MRTRSKSGPPVGAGGSEGRRFLVRIAELVCSECGVTYEFVEEPGAYVITVTGKGQTLRFYFERADADDIDDDNFNIAAMRFLERCLKTFRNASVH